MRLLSLFQCCGESAHSCTDGAWLKFRCIRCTITCTIWTDVGDLSVLEKIQQEQHQQYPISRFITSISFDLTIQFLQTHALRSAEIPSAVVTVVTLAMSRHGPVASNHAVGAELMEHHLTQLVLPHRVTHIRNVRTHHRQTLFCTRPQRDVRPSV